MRSQKSKSTKPSLPSKRIIKPASKTGKLSPSTVKRIVKTIVNPRKK